MHLWTEYEGSTLAGFTLSRLSRSEGRSAFFLTAGGEGRPALLRVTESHFDEGELAGRWQKIAAVSHPGLQAIQQFGQTTSDGVALSYCLLETTDGSLSDVLRERVLSSDEVLEVTEAVAGALAALHAAGLVHGHVDATNVFAVDEVVKLRSDCARECLGDFEADTFEAREALRLRDVHDLGLLLRRCLTPQWQESAATPLPAPFDRIVRRALNGTTTAEEIVAEMDGLKPATVTPPRLIVPDPAAMPHRASPGQPPAAVYPDHVAATRRQILHGGRAEAPATRLDRLAPLSGASKNSPGAVMAALANETEPITAADRAKPRLRGREDGRSELPQGVEAKTQGRFDVSLHALRSRPRRDIGTVTLSSDVLRWLRPVIDRAVVRKRWVVSTAVAVVFGFVLWDMASTRHAYTGAHTVNDAAVPTKAQPAAVQGQTVAGRAPTAQAAYSTEPQRSLINTSATAGWHVIAYTYKYEQQAQGRVTQLRRRYVALQPQVFSPTGRAPYFVALGGSADAASAMALRNRARQAGLPRDTYARNF